MEGDLARMEQEKMIKDSERRIIEKMADVVKASEERILAALGSDGGSPTVRTSVVEDEPVAPVSAPVAPSKPPQAAAPKAQVVEAAAADLRCPAPSDKSQWTAVKGVRSTSGVQVEQSCVEGYNQVRLDRNGVRWVMFCFDKKMEWIYPTNQGKATTDYRADWEGFVSALPDKGVCYVLYQFTYSDKAGSGYALAGQNVMKNKMVLFAWTDSKCGVRDRMIAASSQSAIKQVCRGSMDQPVHDKKDMDYDYIAKELGC